MEPISSPMQRSYKTKEKVRFVKKALKSKLPYAKFALKKNLNLRTLRKWISNFNKIKIQPKNSYSVEIGRVPLYPDVEEQLFTEIQEFRESGLVVNHSTMRLRAKELFNILRNNALNEKVPIFTNSWIKGFMNRYDLIYRKKAQAGFLVLMMVLCETILNKK